MTNQYEASEQKGEPGHGFMAQVFDPNGDAAANFDMTADWSVATGRAALCAEALNVKDATGLTPAQLAEQNKQLLAHLKEFDECSIAGCRAWDEQRLYKLWHDLHRTLRKFGLRGENAKQEEATP